MSLLNWNFEQLKLELSRRKEIKGWIVTEEHTHRREKYLMAENSNLVTDQDRNIYSHNTSLKLFVHLPQKGRHGEITKKIFTTLPLASQIDLAIQAAQQTDHQAWELPTEVPGNIPQTLTADPRIAEDIEQMIAQVTEKIQLNVNQKRSSNFNSAELFLSIHNRELHLSNGLNHRSSQSKIYFETAYSCAQLGSDQKMRSDEYLSSQWAVHLDHLPIEKIFAETAEFAERSLHVTKPPTGKYSVLIHAEVLSLLISDLISKLSAAHSYHGLPFISPGQELIPESHGDLLSIKLDPTLDYGANSTALSDQGLLQIPLTLVEKNQVVATAIDKQYADYLNLKPSSSRGNMIVEPGLHSYQDLTQQGSPILEILQFSGLFTDANSGTFSSEIRLARIFHPAPDGSSKVSYLKGGSLSGSVNENFKGLKLSQSRVNRAHFSSDHAEGQGYYGPEYALLSDVSVVG